MTTANPTAVCRTCGAADLGTRFCESCGAPAARPTDQAPSGSPEVLSTPPVMSSRGAPSALYVLGIVASSVLSIIATAVASSALGQALIPVLDVLTIIVDFAAMVGVLALGRRSSARQGLKIFGAILFLLVPAFDVVILVSDVTGSYGIYAYGASTGFVSLALIAALVWLMVGRFAGRAYFLLFVVLGANLLSYPLQLVNGGSNFVLFYALRIAIVTAGLVVVIIVAPRIKRRAKAHPASAEAPIAYGATPNEAAPGVAPYAATGGTSTTNGFAIAALILGILGGTFLPIVFGHVAHSQIRRTGQAGWGMATAGLVLGYVFTAVALVLIVVAIVAAVQTPHYYY